jgi:hypothetical protein
MEIPVETRKARALQAIENYFDQYPTPIFGDDVDRRPTAVALQGREAHNLAVEVRSILDGTDSVSEEVANTSAPIHPELKAQMEKDGRR